MPFADTQGTLAMPVAGTLKTDTARDAMRIFAGVDG